MPLMYAYNVLISVLIQYCVILNFLSIKPSLSERKHKLLLFLIYLFSTIPNIFIGNIDAIIVLLSISVFFILLKKDILLNICILFITYIFCVVIDNLMSFLINLSGITVAELQANYLLFTIISLVELSIAYGLSKTIALLIKKKSAFISHTTEALPLIGINLLICVIIFVFNVVMGQRVGYTPQIIIFNCALFVLYFIISTIMIVSIFKAYIVKAETTRKQESLDNLMEYTSQIESMYSDLRSFKHDYTNIMLSMAEYINERDLTGLEKHFSENIFPLGKELTQGDFQLNRLINIHSPELKSLVSAKLIYAHELSIDINVEITEPVEIVFMDIIDLSRIIGVFLDNAIEAARETSNPTLSFTMLNNHDSIVMIISNNFITKEINLDEINKLSVSSKGSGRGIGLFNAHKIISHYDNVILDTHYKDNVFTQNLEILAS